MKIHSIFLSFVIISVLALVGCSKNDANDAQAQNTNATSEGNVMTTEDSVKLGLKDTLVDTTDEKVAPIRDPKNPLITIETDFGKMVLELYRDVAPAHADSFISLSKKGFYDGLIFHRVIKNFMIQGGDPKGNGMGDAGYYLKAEFSQLPHQEGTLSMARGRDPNSASSQFFVCLARNSMTSSLDGQYTVFGQLIRGYNTLHSIGDVECGPGNPREMSRPVEEVFIRRVYLSDSKGKPLEAGGEE